MHGRTAGRAAAKLGMGVAAGGWLHAGHTRWLHWFFGGGLWATPLAMRGRGLWVARVAADWLALLWTLTWHLEVGRVASLGGVDWRLCLCVSQVLPWHVPFLRVTRAQIVLWSCAPDPLTFCRLGGGGCGHCGSECSVTGGGGRCPLPMHVYSVPARCKLFSCSVPPPV